jgi:hypothetical protein
MRFHSARSIYEARASRRTLEQILQTFRPSRSAVAFFALD